MSRLLPYETILKAREGDPEAVNAVLLHYAGYIRGSSRSAGGIVGYVDYRGSSSILNCVNSGYAYEGNIAVGSSVKVTNAFYALTQYSKDSYYAYGTPVFRAQFAQQESFPGLDFETDWVMTPGVNSGYPQPRNLPAHLQLNECNLELTAGQTRKLSATWEGEPRTAVWSSDDETVATVSYDGTVTARSIGICIVTATLGDGQKANCCVRVYGAADTVTLPDVTMYTGASETLTCLQSPAAANETVWWTSGDTTVATVNSVTGEVTAKTPGVTTITAELLESGITATCQVTVELAPINSVYFSNSVYSMRVGENKTLSHTIYPTLHGGAVTWKSSNETVATVDAATGVITAKAPGTAVITVESDNGYSAACTVTVTAPVTQMSFEKGSITLVRGFTEQLVLDIQPLNTTDTISYSTNNSTCVSVSKTGLVTANYTGSAMIIATASGGKKAYCTVTVVEPTVPVTSVTIGEDELIMTRAETRQLGASVLPEGATNKTLTWTSSNEDVAVVSNTGVVTAVGEGVTVIRAESDNGMYDECIVSVISAAGPSVVLSTTNGAPGMTVEVTADMVKNPGISGYRFTVDYDAAVLMPTAILPNGDFGGTLETNLDEQGRTELHVLWYAAEDVTANGKLFTVEFTVAEGAVLGSSTPVALTCEAQDICNAAGEHVALYRQGAEIAIAAPLWGDIYGDGELTVYDLTLLARYVTGLDTFTRRQLEIADICTDNDIDIRDVVKLAQQLVASPVLSMPLLGAAPGEEAVPTVTVGTGELNALDEAEIPVSISGNPGISGFRYVIDYDSENLEILDITPDEALAAHFTANLGSGDGQIIVTWYDTEDRNADGELFTITARLKNPEADSAVISIRPAENNMCDAGLTCVGATYTDGGILFEILAALGDVNGNDTIDITDLACLFAYLSTGENEGGLSVRSFRNAADVNGDGSINILDYQALYDQIRTE